MVKKNMQKTEVQNENDSKIREAESGWMNAKNQQMMQFMNLVRRILKQTKKI